jgi:hypothetical protein
MYIYRLVLLLVGRYLSVFSPTHGLVVDANGVGIAPAVVILIAVTCIFVQSPGD